MMMQPLYKRLPPLQSLTFFEAAARHNSFTYAAEELCITQSAVSKQIKQLEEYLNTPLFERTAKGLLLTPQGKDFYFETQAALEKVSIASNKLRRLNDDQSLTIASSIAMAHYWLFPRIAQFAALYPHIDINIFSTDSIDELVCMQHDLAILYGDGQWQAPLTSHHLFNEEIYAVCGKDYQTQITKPEDLLQERLLHLAPSKWRWACWTDWLKHFDVEYQIPKGSLQFNNLPLLLQAATQNMGVALGWEFTIKEGLRNGNLRLVCEETVNLGNADYLVYSSQRPLSAAARCFRDWLIEQETQD